MNQSQKRITTYAVAAIVVLFTLFVVYRFAFREAAPSVDQQPPRTEPTNIPARQESPDFAAADAQPTEAPLVNQSESSTMTNAAVIYRQAFALYDALSKDEKTILSDWQTNVNASVEAELCEKMRPICDLMQRATLVTNCDWGFERPFTQDTLRKLMPLFTLSRGISRAAVWSATHCHQNDQSEAVSDIVAISKFGHSMPPLLIGYLVDLSIQGMMQNFVANHASTLAGSNDPRLRQLFESTQFDEPMFRAFEGDAELSSKPLPAMSDTKRRIFVSMFPRAQSMDTDQINEYIRQAHDWESQYVKTLQMSETEYQQWLTQLREAEKINPLLEGLLASMEQTVGKARMAIIRNDMVTTGLAIVRDGPSALQSHPDPATGQPFLYSETSEGFELQSGSDTNSLLLKMQFK